MGNCSVDEVVIIGGSLSGLTFALACAYRGIPTRVLERVEAQNQGGALGIDRSVLMRAIGLDPRDTGTTASFPVLTNYRNAASWQSIHRWLREQALQLSDITLIEGIAVSEVWQTDTSATVIMVDGSRIEAPVIVGADGYRSVVRRAISSDQPGCRYAGYLLWRGLVNESDLPSDTPWARNNDGKAFRTETGYRLVAYPVASDKGSLEPGERLISFAWYDSTCEGLLRELNCISPEGEVLASLAQNLVPNKVRDELCGLARRIWPEPWRTAIAHALEYRQVFATPVPEYFPDRLHRGQLAIIGDAAHVASPVTGEGFVAGILDAEALADALKDSFDRTNGELLSALRVYEQMRLASARELVATSRLWSSAYLRGEQIPSSLVLERGNTDTKHLLIRTRKK